jgi:hypothetical protein
MQNLRSELTETVEKAQVELQTVEVSLNKRTWGVEKEIASIKEGITSNNRKFQSQLEEAKVVSKEVDQQLARISSTTNIQQEYIVERIPARV